KKILLKLLLSIIFITSLYSFDMTLPHSQAAAIIRKNNGITFFNVYGSHIKRIKRSYKDYT
ncbi:MAG: hypothetical protein K6G09_02865, partial [Treponema sp.]|nr:hypothetical protein [Treponema sp.]